MGKAGAEGGGGGQRYSTPLTALSGFRVYPNSQEKTVKGSRQGILWSDSLYVWLLGGKWIEWE